MKYCELCGETLQEDEERYHRMPNIDVPMATGEACLRAATGDYARILRVHHRLVLDSNPRTTLE